MLPGRVDYSTQAACQDFVFVGARCMACQPQALVGLMVLMMVSGVNYLQLAHNAVHHWYLC
jgi:hypothetical protein